MEVEELSNHLRIFKLYVSIRLVHRTIALIGKPHFIKTVYHETFVL